MRKSRETQIDEHGIRSERLVSGLHKLHLVVRTMTALQSMGFQSNYRWNHCESRKMTTVRIEGSREREDGWGNKRIECVLNMRVET